MSAADLVLADAAGALVAGRESPAALVAGAASTTLALMTFSGWRVQTEYLDDRSGQQQFLRYALPGLACGPLCGWLGSVAASRRQSLVLLPLALALSSERLASGQRLGFAPGPSAPWRVEIALGIGLALGCLGAAAYRQAVSDPRHSLCTAESAVLRR